MDIQIPKTPTVLYLVRHGQSEWNGKIRIPGQCDPPLSKKGTLQSRALATVLADRELSAVYTSTLRRTIDTGRTVRNNDNLPIGTGIQSGLRKVQDVSRI